MYHESTTERSIALVLTVEEDEGKLRLGSPEGWMKSNVLELKCLGLVILMKKKVHMCIFKK